jgi:hypothetical protein
VYDLIDFHHLGSITFQVVACQSCGLIIELSW